MTRRIKKIQFPQSSSILGSEDSQGKSFISEISFNVGTCEVAVDDITHKISDEEMDYIRFGTDGSTWDCYPRAFSVWKEKETEYHS